MGTCVCVFVYAGVVAEGGAPPWTSWIVAVWSKTSVMDEGSATALTCGRNPTAGCTLGHCWRSVSCVVSMGYDYNILSEYRLFSGCYLCLKESAIYRDIKERERLNIHLPCKHKLLTANPPFIITNTTTPLIIINKLPANFEVSRHLSVTTQAA